MPDLHFQVETAEATPHAFAPQLSFKVRITNVGAEPVHSIAMRAQVQIEPARRSYNSVEQEHLKDLFDTPERWNKTLHSLLWTNAMVNVPGFTSSTLVEIPVPCTFDFQLAVTKYINGLEGGDLPVSMLFSGTIFYAGGSRLQVAQIPWDKEANYRLPVRVWKEMMDLYYPNVAWLELRRDVFERLVEFKSRNGIATWEQTLERMLDAQMETKP